MITKGMLSMTSRDTKMKRIRQAMGLSATQVSERLSITRQFYCAVENARLVPIQRIQNLISQFFKLPFDMLVEGVDEQTTNTIINAITGDAPSIKV
jgi:transcriptional regulator with XRE-family HTH domain